MAFNLRVSAVVTATAVTGGIVLATPAEAPATAPPPSYAYAPVELTASSLLLEPSATPDQIDQSFIDFRTSVRVAFTPAANQLGYLGKQLYIGFNFGESIIASAVFNGTDVLRGEGFVKNLGEFANDVFLAAVWIVADEAYLHIPGLPPIVTLPNRPPSEHVPGWRRPLSPQPGRDLVVPVPYVPESEQSRAMELSPADEAPDIEIDTDEPRLESRKPSATRVDDEPTDEPDAEKAESEKAESDEATADDATDADTAAKDSPGTDDDESGSASTSKKPASGSSVSSDSDSDSDDD